VNIFLMADSVTCGLEGQDTPKGYYNIGSMIKFLVNKGMDISACGSCMDARAIDEDDFLRGVERGSMDQLAEWSIRSDDVIVF
ncbi:MAG: DsrE/DsrF/TusD sulfur relay family protein, partial [Candidatus Natronoplasma sp.]